MSIIEAHITQITDLSKDVRSFHIHVPNRPDYKPGQFCVLSVEAQGKIRKRAYSMASSPHWDNVELIIRKVPDGRVTPVLFDLKVGDPLEVAIPFGIFYLDRNNIPAKIVLMAGGVGISAIISIVRYLKHINYQGEAILMQASRTPQDVLCREELDALSQEWPHLRIIRTVDKPDNAWSGEAGYISVEMIAKYCDVKNAHFYMCGPPQFVGHMEQNLEHLDVSHDRIKNEKW